MKCYAYLLGLIFLASAVLHACDEGNCPLEKTVEINGSSVLVDAALKAPKDYINLEKNRLPFGDVLRKISGLLPADEPLLSLKNIIDLMNKGRKSVPKKLLKEALEQAMDFLERHPEVPAEFTARASLIDQVASCLAFFAENSIPVQAMEMIPSTIVPVSNQVEVSQASQQ